MGARPVSLICVLALGWVGGTGCAPTWCPGKSRVELHGPPLVLDLSPYLNTPVPQRRVFARRDVRNPENELPPYEQIIEEGRRVEGTLVGCRLKPLTEYLLPDADARTYRGLPWPAELATTGAAFFLYLDNPMPMIPAEIQTTRSTTLSTTLRYFNCHGRRPRNGTLWREVAFEGPEMVQAGGETFADCVRLRIVSKVRIDWGPWVDITEHVWLARDVGEVRRVEHIQCLAWLVCADEAYSYERLRGLEPPLPPSERPESPPRWSCVAVHVDPALPHPRLAGLILDTARLGDGGDRAAASSSDATSAPGAGE